MYGKYCPANRFYCTVCKNTFFMPQDQNHANDLQVLFCPICGKRKVRYTSNNWWVEKVK